MINFIALQASKVNFFFPGAIPRSKILVVDLIRQGAESVFILKMGHNLKKQIFSYFFFGMSKCH